ncbi:MAG: serine hydrolase domain-containing protein [Chitinophagaceae bacterium]
MKYFLSIFLVLAASFLATANAQTVTQLDNLVMADIDAAVLAEMSQSNLPGVNIAVIYNGRVAYTKAYGLASPGNNATTSTKYPIASISKTITGVLAMKLVENHDLALNDLVRNYVAGYTGSTITIRHLLCHQSGIGHYDDCPGGYNGAFNAISSLGVVNGCSRCMTPPGSGTIYSTFGSILLGVIIDKVGKDVYNKSYTQLYNDWIKAPGGLTNLTAEHDNAITNLATGYSENGGAISGYWNDIGWKLPAGGFVSTAHDLAKFGVGVMNYTFINSTTSDTMWKKQSTTGTPTNNCATALENPYALAFASSGSASTLTLSHSGLNDNGYSSLMYLYPHVKSGIVFLTNRAQKTGALYDLISTLGTKVKCPTNREFTSPINWGGDWIYEGATIKASSAFTSTGAFVLDGGTEVILQPGFHAAAGTNFRAVNDGCQGTINP